MENIIIYGIGAQARQLKAYIDNDKSANVHAFIVDKAYKKFDFLCGVPVVEFENIEKYFPREKYRIIVSFAYTNMMKNRQEKIENCKVKGYNLFSYISKDAKIFTSELGESVIIYPNVTIAPYTKIGNGCFFEISCSVAHDCIIEDYCFFAPGATLCGETKLENNVFVGSRAVITNNLKINSFTFISANATVSRNTETGQAVNRNGEISAIDSFAKMDRMK